MTQMMTQNSHYLLLVRLDNGSAIGETYGDQVVNFALEHLQHGLECHLQVVDMRRMGCDEIELLIQSDATDQAQLEALVDELCAELALDIFHYGSERIVLAVSAGFAVPHPEDWGIHRQEARARLAAATAPADLPGPHSIQDRKSYRNDMGLAATVLHEVAHGNASFARRPIYQLENSAEVSHFEVQLRLHDQRGEQVTCDEGIQALERLGMSYLLDRQLVSQALDELAADPFLSISVGISAQSLSLDINGEAAAWTELLARLQEDQDIARRLIVEIQDTTPIASMHNALAFARALRSLGASISVAGLGSGPTSIRQLVDLRPDIVKLDSDALNVGALMEGNSAVVEHLIILAHALADRVILDGIEVSPPVKAGERNDQDWMAAAQDKGSDQDTVQQTGVVHDLMAHRTAQDTPFGRSAAC